VMLPMAANLMIEPGWKKLNMLGRKQLAMNPSTNGLGKLVIDALS
jgi:hypothetical protein